MRVIDINGRLATAGSWDETSQSEADAQARLRATRTGLRAMLAGNEAFHVDPMAAPGAGLIGFSREPEAEVWHTEAPTVAGVYVATLRGFEGDAYCAKFHRAYFDGVEWSGVWNANVFVQPSPDEQERGARLSRSKVGDVVWLKIIEADTPVPAAQIPVREGDYYDESRYSIQA